MGLSFGAARRRAWLVTAATAKAPDGAAPAGRSPDVDIHFTVWFTFSMNQPAGRFGSIREFIEEAIEGKHSPDEVNAILDQIELGIGLRKRDEALAAEFERDDGPALGPLEEKAWRAGRNSVLEVVTPALAATVQGIRRTKDSRCPVCRSKLGTGAQQKHREDCQLWAAVGLVVDHGPVPTAVPPGIPEVAEMTVEVKGGEPVYRMTTHDELARRRAAKKEGAN